MGILFLLIGILFCGSNYAATGIDLEEFNQVIREYGSDLFPEVEEGNIVEKAITGKMDFSLKGILKRVTDFFTKELRENVHIIFQLLGIVILCSILRELQSSFSEKGVGEVAFYVCYILVIVLVVSSFSSIMMLTRETIERLSSFMYALIPIMVGLLLATGNITTVAVIQPVLVVMVQCISAIFSNIIIPLIFLSAIIHVISNISSQMQLVKLGSFIKSTSVWVVGILLTIFVGILSLEGSLSSSVDGITAKTAKATVSSVVPVVGKILGDAVDSVIGGSVILKNAVGFIGVIIILGISLIPIIKIGIIMLVYNLSAALVEPIADSRITKCISSVGDSMKIIFGILVAITFLFIIATTLIVKMGNLSMMYR